MALKLGRDNYILINITTACFVQIQVVPRYLGFIIFKINSPIPAGMKFITSRRQLYGRHGLIGDRVEEEEC